MAFGVSMLGQMVANRYVAFATIQRRFNIQFGSTGQCFPSFESMSIWRDSPTRHATQSLDAFYSDFGKTNPCTQLK